MSDQVSCFFSPSPFSLFSVFFALSLLTALTCSMTVETKTLRKVKSTNGLSLSSTQYIVSPVYDLSILLNGKIWPSISLSLSLPHPPSSLSSLLSCNCYLSALTIRVENVTVNKKSMTTSCPFRCHFFANSLN